MKNQFRAGNKNLTVTLIHNFLSFFKNSICYEKYFILLKSYQRDGSFFICGRVKHKSIWSYTTVTSRLDQCSALYIGPHSKSVWNLQLVQNTTAQLLPGAKQNMHVIPFLQMLHWLLVFYQ